MYPYMYKSQLLIEIQVGMVEKSRKLSFRDNIITNILHYCLELRQVATLNMGH